MRQFGGLEGLEVLNLTCDNSEFMSDEEGVLFESFTHIRTLSLDVPRYNWGYDYHHVLCLRRLKMLTVSRDVPELLWPFLERLPELEHLTCERWTDAICYIPNLVTLSISSVTPYTWGFPQQCRTMLTRLQSVSLRQQSFPISSMAHIPGLEVFKLNGMLDDNKLVQLAILSLKSLTLQAADVSNTSVAHIANMTTLTLRGGTTS
ncbi:TPA: hypothetical protein ACH3X1_007197 [Trebouxia sp. C0004]